MADRYRILILSLIFFLMIIIASAQPGMLNHFCLNERGNYTGNSDYLPNLVTLLNNLPSTNGNGFGFYSLSFGKDVDKANAIGLCRGDVGPTTCRGCLKNATGDLIEVCLNLKEAVVWYDRCMLRYSNRSLSGFVETTPKFFMRNRNNVSSNVVGPFFETLRSLLDGLKNRATSGGSLRKFATANTSAPGFLTIYALVQCTPDLSPQDCNNCLDDAFAYIPQCCDSRIGARVLGPSCNFRYETYLFYQTAEEDALPPFEASPPMLQAALVSPPPQSSTTNTTSSSRNVP